MFRKYVLCLNLCGSCNQARADLHSLFPAIKLQNAWQSDSLLRSAINKHSLLGYVTVKSGRWVKRFGGTYFFHLQGNRQRPLGSTFTAEYVGCIFLLNIGTYYQTTQCHKPGDHNMHIHSCEDLMPYTTYYNKRCCLERGALSLVSTTEELLGRYISGSGLQNREYGRADPLR
jgi:hypothetical protein